MSFTKKILPLAVAAALPMMAAPNAAFAGADPFIGEITYVGFNFPPRDWAQCNGQLLPIQQYTSLFSLLGNRYGGDGRIEFALPDMRGRVPIHYGRGPGVSPYSLGQMGGYERITLNVDHMPSHTHGAVLGNVNAKATATSTLKVSASGGTAAPAGNSLPGQYGRDNFYSATAPDTAINAASVDTVINSMDVTGTVSIANTGGGQSFPVVQPYTTLNCIIALEGIYPPRN